MAQGTNNPAGTNSRARLELPPVTPRDFFNTGTRQLARGQLREAEASLETVLASQVDRLRTPALYNLGHIRFQQGVAEIQKAAQGGSQKPRSEAAVGSGAQAVHTADQALAGNDVRQLVAAYMRGRGARRELNAALKAVKKAMQQYGSALNRWERSSADFKSALELYPRDADSRHNSDVLDRSIARLIDSLMELEQMASQLGQQKKELGEKMNELKGRIPEEDMPPGAPGDDEEEEEPQGPEPGQQEGPGTESEEMPLSPEQASWMLDAYKLGSDRRLPMGADTNAEPKLRDRPTW